MRPLLIILLLPLISQGQSFNKFTSIRIEYTVGHYNFGDTGHYETKEIIDFLPIAKGRLKRNVCQIQKRYLTNPQTLENNLSIKDTIFNQVDKTFSFKDFQNVISQLNTPVNNFDIKKLQSDLSKSSKKEILAVAKKHNKGYYFIDDENGKVDEFGRKRLKKMRNLVLLDSFLIYNAPSLKYEMMVTDGWNNMKVILYEPKDTVLYQFQLYYSLLGQPVSKVVNNNFSNSTRFINSEINGALVKILPKNSFAKKVIEYDRLKEEYFLWFIDNKIWDKE